MAAANHTARGPCSQGARLCGHRARARLQLVLGLLLLGRRAVPAHSSDMPGLRAELSASKQPEPVLLQVLGGRLHKVRLRGAPAPRLRPNCPRFLP